MTTHRSRACRPGVDRLEGREMLTVDVLSALWIGQDGHDLVGPSSAPGGDDVQDIHIALSGLEAGRTIVRAEVQGLGGDDWQYQGPWGPWRAELVRAAGSATADVYVEPSRVETGRPFQVSVIYDDASTASAWFAGGAADPNLRMPAATAGLAWVGQDGRDFVGTGPAVGPDGIQDLHLALGNLSPTVAITSITVASSSGASWAFGTNPAGYANIEMDRHGDDPSRADLYLGAGVDPNGQTLTATIVYENNKVDTATLVAGHADPALAQASTAGPLPTIRDGVAATWAGQDGQDLAGPGSARLVVSGLPEGRSVVAAELSDPARNLWVYRTGAGAGVYSDGFANALAFRADGTGADVGFAPLRDEAGDTLTLRLVFDDGSTSISRVVAGSTDPSLLAPGPAAASVVAHPGDDLNDLANRFGTVRLSPGVYPLNAPLVLNRPVAILAAPGVTLQFSQGAADPAWSAAIKIHAGRTTLDGFAVRFATPVRWADNVSYGPAVIGTTDNLDPNPGSIKVGLAITHLDLQSPPVPSGNVEAPRLIRVVSALNGTIAGNTLKGGTTEFLGGPWTIADNTYLGTVPNTYCWTAFAGHGTRDLILRGNTAQPTGASGKTWRFLVLTGAGYGDLVADNTVVGIGPRDGDAQDANAAEIILTESYSLNFEGTPTQISPDGRILQIPSPQGGAATTGSVVAILSGPNAGQYRRIAQAIGPQTYLMDEPLPAGSYAISIASGFVGETFRGNTIDSRGSGAAGDLILAGNHFGAKVLNNHLLGGADSFRLTASPSEHPNYWGWSHVAFLGATIDGNTLEDALRGATLSVEHSAAIKTDAGRVYFSGALTNNTVVWSPAFVAATGGAAGVPGLVVGEAGSIDPGELRLTTSGNGATVPPGTTAPTLRVVAGQITLLSPASVPHPVARSASLPAPTGLALVNDTGMSAQDRETMDGRVTFNAVPGAVGYEYMVSNGLGYVPLASPGAFLPAGITPASNTIWVRAIDAQGNRSAEATVSYFLDNEPPITSIPFLRPSDDTGALANDRVTSVATLDFGVTGEVSDTMILYRDGREIARRLGTGPLSDPAVLPDGVYGYTLRRYDAAGNTSVSPVAAVTIDRTPPAAVFNLSATADGHLTFGATGADDRYEYQIGPGGAFVSIDRQSSFVPSGAYSGSQVGVRAIDRAGNIGPESWVTLGGSTTPGVGSANSSPKVPQGPAALTPPASPRLSPKAAARARAKAAAQARVRALAQARANARAQARAHLASIRRGAAGRA